jgi:hypothetical protein
MIAKETIGIARQRQKKARATRVLLPRLPRSDEARQSARGPSVPKEKAVAATKPLSKSGKPPIENVKKLGDGSRISRPAAKKPAAPAARKRPIG